MKKNPSFVSEKGSRVVDPWKNNNLILKMNKEKITRAT
jgi:hypothetical protein